MGKGKVSLSPRTDGSKVLLPGQWCLRTVLTLLLLLTVFPFVPYMDGYTLLRLSPWVEADTTFPETIIWSIILIGPAVSALLAGSMLLQISRHKSDVPPLKSVRYLYFLLWISVISWLLAITCQIEDLVSGRLTGSELQGWSGAIGMYLFPIAAIIAFLFLREVTPRIMGPLLSTTLNLSLFWFLLLAAGVDQLSLFSCIYFTTIVILAIICISNMQVYRR
jgi:hypothetical protein